MKITKILFEVPFEQINLNDEFFDSLRNSYHEFNAWFKKKAEEGRKANCVVYSNDKIIAFLSLKIEDENTKYLKDIPSFESGIKRLKISTFKIIKNSERRLGERFIQRIYKSAMKEKIKFIYLTLFNNENTLPLVTLLTNYGFYRYQNLNNRGEEVWIKTIHFSTENSPKGNYPLNLDGLKNNSKVYWLPIENKYHNKLIGFDANSKKLDKGYYDRASIYTIEKYYISFVSEYKLKNLHSGDILLIYRMGDKWTQKSYSSIVTSYGVFESYDKLWGLTKYEFFNKVKNRTAYSEQELEEIYKFNEKCYLISFLFISPIYKYKNETNKPYWKLKDLWDNKILDFPNGPRPFDIIKTSAFLKLLNDKNN
ncbi:MAG: hypothetical protein IJP83_01520 [Mycoplasma sp.]|nr:hypothetical protein [Mycoplasma sp.]